MVSRSKTTNIIVEQARGSILGKNKMEASLHASLPVARTEDVHVIGMGLYELYRRLDHAGRHDTQCWLVSRHCAQHNLTRHKQQGIALRLEH